MAFNEASVKRSYDKHLRIFELQRLRQEAKLAIAGSEVVLSDERRDELRVEWTQEILQLRDEIKDEVRTW